METIEVGRLREDTAKLKRMSDMMKVMGHTSRLSIVDLLLEEGTLPVGDIADAIGISQSNTSQHLKALEGVGAVLGDRRGTYIYYSIKNPMVETLVNCVNQCTAC